VATAAQFTISFGKLFQAFTLRQMNWNDNSHCNAVL